MDGVRVETEGRPDQVAAIVRVWIRSQGLRARPVRHGELRWRAVTMLQALGIPEAELSILLCDDDTIRKLNKKFRKRNQATDVLAFPMHEAGAPAPRLGSGAVLGDVVISVPTATRQAELHGRAIVSEVTFLLAHGLLHLLGYDHQTRDEERRMMAVTDGLLAAVRAAGRSR